MHRVHVRATRSSSSGRLGVRDGAHRQAVLVDPHSHTDLRGLIVRRGGRPSVGRGRARRAAGHAGRRSGAVERGAGVAADRPVRTDDGGELPGAGHERAGDLRVVRTRAAAPARLAAARRPRPGAADRGRDALRRPRASIPGDARLSADAAGLPRAVPLQRPHRRDPGGHRRLRRRAAGARDRAAGRGAAARNAAAQPDQLPDGNCDQGGTRGPRRRRRRARSREARDRLLATTRPRYRRSDEGRAGGRDSRRPRHLERRGRDALRDDPGGNDGALLRDVLRRRAASVCGVHGGHAREHDPARRHLRHARGRTARDRRRPPDRAGAPRRATRLGRPACPFARGPRPPR